MNIRLAVPENGSVFFVANGKKQKKTSVKHIRIRLIGGCVNCYTVTDSKIETPGTLKV